MANRFFRRDHAIGFDVDDQLVEVGALLDTGRFNEVGHPAHWRERRIQNDAADGLVRIFAQTAHVARHVATALFDLDLHVQLAAGGEMRDDVVRIDQLDVVRQIDIRCQYRTFAILFQRQGDRIAVVHLEHDALQIQQQVDYIFLHAVERRILVYHASDRHFGRRIANHRRQQHATQGIAQRMAVAALKRFHHNFGVTGT